MKQIFKVILVLLISNLSFYNSIKSQGCGDNDCTGIQVYCSILELNDLICQAKIGQDGYNCSNQSDYIQWWPIHAVGNNSITISPLSGCSNGILFVDLYESCSCHPFKSTQVSNSAKTISFSTNECKVFRLSIRNSNSNNCQYIINTSTNTTPSLNGSLGLKNKIYDYCVSTCYRNFWVNIPTTSSNCRIIYNWELDGQLLTSTQSRAIEYKFTKEGTFTLCVTASLQPQDGANICDQVKECATINISNNIPRYASSIRFICSEKTPFIWGTHLIKDDGVYTSQFEKECCAYDSTVEFKILKPELENTNFISCDGTIYVDPVTNISYPQCFSKKKILLQKNREFGCDNSYYLSTSYPKIKPKWIINNVNGAYEIDPNIQIKDLCDAQIGIENYSWFKKSDPQQTIISKNKKLTIATPDNYCLNYLATIKLGPENQVCTFTFCEPFTQAPTADFISNKQMFCPGTNVTFTEQCSQDAIAWHWELVGADPSESSLRYPTVYYDKPGIYPVKLTVENQYFSSTITKTTYINVIKSPLCNVKEKKKKKFPIGFGLTENELQDRSSELSEILIMPNPNNGSFQITGIQESATGISIKIFNLLGKFVYEYTTSDLVNNPIRINDIHLSAGTYWVKISGNNLQKVIKMIVLGE